MQTREPGTFSQDDVEVDSYQNSPKIEFIAITGQIPSLIECFTVYKNHFTEPRRILYPACWGDISLVSVFPKAEIVFVDPNEPYITAIQKDVQNAVTYCMNFEDFKKWGFDLGFIANAWGKDTHTNLPNHIKKWGHLLSDGGGWNFDAESFFTHPKTHLIGVFLSEQNWLSFSQENLNLYLHKIGVNELGRWIYENRGAYYLFEITQ